MDQNLTNDIMTQISLHEQIIKQNEFRITDKASNRFKISKDEICNKLNNKLKGKSSTETITISTK